MIPLTEEQIEEIRALRARTRLAVLQMAPHQAFREQGRLILDADKLLLSLLPEGKPLVAHWMFDNHTFREVDLAGDWKKQVADLHQEDGCGSLFVRQGEKVVMYLHGHGKARREEFLTELEDLKPPEL